jgi:hypothetical protein
LTPFFVPKSAGRTAESAYDAIRDAVQEQTGHRPLERRIAKLSARREGADVDTEVGHADPVCGQTVTAILDLGRHLPYLVHCGRPGSASRQLLVPKPVYDVTEFSG